MNHLKSSNAPHTLAPAPAPIRTQSRPKSLTRRTLLTALPALALFSRLGRAQRSAPRLVFASNSKSKPGIYSAGWNQATGEIGELVRVGEMSSPTFLAEAHSGGRTCLYAVNEANGPKAFVEAFQVQGMDASLRSLGTRPTDGDAPTHLSVSPDGRVVAVANYSGGSVSSYRIQDDGSLSAVVSHVQYTGHGPNPQRQEKPHAHSARFSPDGRFLLVNDLGLDRIVIYRVDSSSGALTPNDPPFWTATPGSGPRHVAFHPGGRWLYCVNELDSTVDVLAWYAKAGTLTAHTRLSTLAAGFPLHTAFAGEIALSADGRSLYVGNRVASDTIAVFAVEQGGAALRLLQIAPNGGRNTRHLTADPSGRWMLLSNVGSGTIVVLERDRKSGRLSEPRHTWPLDGVMFAGFLSL